MEYCTGSRVIEQIVALHELEQLQIPRQRRPRRERQQRGAKGYVGNSGNLQGSDHVISGVTLVEIPENTVVHLLHGRQNEDAPERCQFHDHVTMLDQVLDLGREVEAQLWVAVAHLPNNPERVLHTV